MSGIHYLLNNSSRSEIFPAMVDTYYGNLSSIHNIGSSIGCSKWMPTNHILYHLANGMFCLGLMIPEAKYGALLLHSLMFLGSLLMSIWSWVIVCAPDFFSWNFAFLILNGIQAFSLIYTIRPVRFCDELEDVYVTLFQPLRVSRHLFKKLVSPEFCTLMTLHEGETYATQSVTRTDKLGLIINGVMHAYSHRSFLHSITEKQFIDSPEFESTLTGDEKFQVSIVAARMCRFLFWPRQDLEYLLIKEPYLASVMKTIIGRDIINKLYALNDKVTTPAGSRLDIRLPSIPCNIRQRRDLRRALVGALGNEVMVTEDNEGDATATNEMMTPAGAQITFTGEAEFQEYDHDHDFDKNSEADENVILVDVLSKPIKTKITATAQGYAVI